MTKNESDNIDRYLDIHNPKKNLDSNEYRRQLTNNKRSLKKLGYDIKGIFSFSYYQYTIIVLQLNFLFPFNKNLYFSKLPLFKS